MDKFNDDTELTQAERDAFASLASDRAYFRGIEDQTVASLHREGLLRHSRPAIWLQTVKYGGLAAALFVAFLLGTEFQKTRIDDPGNIAPVAETDGEGEAMAVTFHLDIDPWEESFSNANAHPKERLIKSLSQDD